MSKSKPRGQVLVTYGDNRRWPTFFSIYLQVEGLPYADSKLKVCA